jgi:hypothetical protein
MNKNLSIFNYVKEQLIFLKTKVDLENQLNLNDINKLCETIFMNILNDTYDFNLKNANNVFHENYPAIDLIDDKNKIVFQVTSTTTTKKIRDTIQKWEKGNFSNYKLKFFFLKDKPTLSKTIKEFNKKGLLISDLIDIADILKIVESDSSICKKIYDSLKIHLEVISFDFNINNYFKNFEPHLEESTSKLFETYKNKFFDFIESDKKIMEIHSSGGNGKSHLLKFLCEQNTSYIPLIFTKQVNIYEDLKKLPNNKNFIFIFDDIDRFLDRDILSELISYTLQNDKIKLLLTYRTASKNLIKHYYRRYSSLQIDEIEIIWNEEDIKDLIKFLQPNIKSSKISLIQHNLNNNPYLITQAIKGNINSIKDFSIKMITDVQNALIDFKLTNEELNQLIFKLSITVPIHEQNIEKLNIPNIKNIMFQLENSKILRKLGNKYRFNPDILGDLYLSYFIDTYKDKFESILENYLGLFSNTVFTNISYALRYLDNKDTLQKYLDNLVSNWINKSEYSSYHLQLINRVVTYIPEKSFFYLINATKKLTPQENNHLPKSVLQEAVTTVSYGADFNQNNTSINLGSIEPIISQIIYLLKNNYDCGEITIKDILNYLTSDEILNLPKPYYSNHELKSILSKLFSPLRTTNHEVILNAITIAEDWIKKPLNTKKVKLFNDVVIQNLLGVTFDDSYSEGTNYTFQKKMLNVEHQEIIEIIHKVKNIVLNMFDNDEEEIVYMAINAIRADAYHYGQLSKSGKEFYGEIKKEFLSKIIVILEEQDKLSLKYLSKIDNTALNILTHDNEKKEALTIIEKITRKDDFIFYQIVQNKDFIITSFDTFYNEYIKQENKTSWLVKAQQRRKYYGELDDNLITVITRLANVYNQIDLLNLINLLDMTNWGSYNKLLLLLDSWFKVNNESLISLYNENFNEIKDVKIKNLLKELLLKKSIINLTENDINKNTSVEDLKIYTIVIFKDFNKSKIKLFDKLFNIVLGKDKNTLCMFVSIFVGDIYFSLKNDSSLADIWQQYIYRLIILSIKYNFDFDSYINFSLELLKQENKLPNEIRDTLLLNIVQDDNFEIEEHELEKLYEILDLKLENLLENLYNKLTSKKEDGFYKYVFAYYMDYSGLNEVIILKKYIKSYSDFKLLTEISYKYYSEFVEYSDDSKSREIRIDLDWFFKYNVNYEYIETFFEELYKEKDIEKIKVFYKIVPVSLEYIRIIANNINLLNNIIDDDKIIDYLNQVNKIKSYSKEHMQNSQMLLDEEKLFTELLEKVESFSLRIKVKDVLKYIELEKRREIESDIEFILDK